MKTLNSKIPKLLLNTVTTCEAMENGYIWIFHYLGDKTKSQEKNKDFFIYFRLNHIKGCFLSKKKKKKLILFNIVLSG